MLRLFKKSISIIIALFFVQIAFGQFDIPEKPKLQTSVYDYANVLSKSQETSLKSKLIHYSDSTSTQIVVITIASLKGESINLLAAKWGQEWGVGQAKEDNGIVVLLAKNDRKIAIQTGYGIEHLLTDALSKRIIQKIILPEFKRGDYYAGLDKGTYAIFEVLKGTYKNNQPASGKPSGGIPRGVIVFVIFIVLMIIFSKKNKGGGNNGGNRRGRGSLLDAIILSSLGSRGFGGGGSFGGGSSGGGFGSGGFGGGFGGGGFGGGGASGGW